MSRQVTFVEQSEHINDHNRQHHRSSSNREKRREHTDRSNKGHSATRDILSANTTAEKEKKRHHSS